MPIKKRPPMPTATFPQRLRKTMMEKNMTQSELARQVSYTPTGVWNWLQGNTLPRPETLMAVANVLDVTEDWLRDGDVTEIGGISSVEQNMLSDTIADKIELLRSEIATLTGYELNQVKIAVEFGNI